MTEPKVSGSGRWRDTNERYGLVSRCLHWATAYLLVWQFSTLVGWRILGDGAFMRTVSNLGPYHGTVGVLVLAIFVPRFCWALLSRRRRRQPDGSLRLMLAGGVHMIFYLLMFVVPALALLRAYGNGKGYDLWGATLIPATGREMPWLTAPADMLHGPLAWTLSVLIAGHIVMALLPHDGEAPMRRVAGFLGK